MVADGGRPASNFELYLVYGYTRLWLMIDIVNMGGGEAELPSHRLII